VNRYVLLLSVFALSLATHACDNSFSPKTEYEDRVVVFCVLDPTAPYQVVRLESTYDADLSNPQQPMQGRDIDQATVIIRSNQGSFTFSDTLIAQPDGSLKKVWVNHRLIPVEGRVYTLTVDVPGFDRITAQTLVPSRAYLQVHAGDLGVRLSSIPTTAYPATAYYFRMWVVGTRNVDGVDIEVRREVPVRYNADTDEYEYGGPSRQVMELFTTGNMVWTQTQLRVIDNVNGRDVVSVAYSLDQFVYSYFQLVRGFDDPTSMRLDRPDISNIQNGVGIFGSIYPDSMRSRYSALVHGG